MKIRFICGTERELDPHYADGKFAMCFKCNHTEEFKEIDNEVRFSL